VLRNWPLYKPIVAAVNGFCTAGGMEMLGGVDIRVACPEAKFAVMEPKRGLFAGGGTTVRLPRQVPWAQAMEFLLCADLIDAQRAYDMGLLNAIVPSDRLLDAAYAFARRITANAPLAVRATKQSALQGLYHDEDTTKQLRTAVRALRAALLTIEPGDAGDAATATTAIASAAEVLETLGKELRTAFEKESRLSSAIFQTEDAREGPKAFAEKRQPNWQGR
jgi:enoyl-CoA hydratase